MEKIKEDFNVPYYIFEEIVQYIELSAQGHCKTAKMREYKDIAKISKN